jgi:hypothetical protein
MGELCQRNVCWCSIGTRVASREAQTGQATPCARMPRFVCLLPLSLTPSLKKDAPLLAPVRRGRCQATRHRSQTPFFDVCLNEDETHLTKVDMYSTRTVCADGGEEVLSLQVVRKLVQLLAIPGEEDTACPGSIAYPNDVSLYVGRPEGRGSERLIESAMPARNVSHRGPVKT